MKKPSNQLTSCTRLSTSRKLVIRHVIFTFSRCLHLVRAGAPAQPTEDSSSWNTRALLRQCVARQFLSLLADAGRQKRNKCVSHWPDKYGVHLVSSLPPPPSAWVAMEAKVLSSMTTLNLTPAAALFPHLTSAIYAVPSTPSTQGDRCQLAPNPMCARFLEPELNAFVAQLFHCVTIASQHPRAKFPQVSLSSYDLFHAHLFLAAYNLSGTGADSWKESTNSRGSITSGHEISLISNRCQLAARGKAQPIKDGKACSVHVDHAPNEASKCSWGLGMLFHCKEYPAYDEACFPYHLGFCQAGSNVGWDGFHMRNVVWFKGSMAFLDTGQGTLPHHHLLWAEARELQTVYEQDMGACVANITYLPNVESLMNNKLDLGNIYVSPLGPFVETGSNQSCL